MRPTYKGAMADEATPARLPPQPSLTAVAPRTEPLAIVSLVLAFPLLIFGWLFSFFGLVIGVVAIIFGHVARSRIRKSGGEVGGMSDSFQQIIAWTTKSRWLKQNQELREITNSFHSEK
jgi:hypothetical protein